MNTEFKIIRIYPHGYNYTNLKELEKLLNEGYIVVKVDKLSKTNIDRETYEYNDYILKKETE
ncbi:MAG: hypothetical protein EOL97_12595 [Spirochaetia bacterium]|nr:hypothetical protein [Spirochaetia bacterium]